MIQRMLYKLANMILNNFNRVKNKLGFWIFIFSLILSFVDYTYPIYGMIMYALVIANRRTNLSLRKLNISLYDKDIPKELDAIIDDAFNEYILLNEGFKKDKEYIRSSEEREIINKLINSVSGRISSVMMDKLNAYYNRETVPIIISTKIYMAVTAYVADNNRVKDDVNIRQTKYL